MDHLTTETFSQNAKSALADFQLRSALRHATSIFRERRQVAAASVSNWEELRSHARAVKDETLNHLDRYLEQFVSNAESRGAKVHWAETAQQANDIIRELMTGWGARTVIKSKSMTTEETHLNDALEAQGLNVVETDLGEYIIQLARETPSHIIAPAIHKSKTQVSELFASKLGIAPTDDISELTQAARLTLRHTFAAADVGITGVNFGVAETGTIVLIENEGNIRFTTSLPRFHIAVMGIEKVVPRFSDLDLFLKLLPRSGTGQRASSYQSFITGTKRRPQDEGPDEVHIVLLDNGRSPMLAQSITRQSLACIRCGACLNVCPVYQQIGGHAYGSVYPGPIGAVITPQLIGLEKTVQLPYASSLCGSCKEVCPVKIDIPALLLHLRSEITQKSNNRQIGSRRTSERIAFKIWTKIVTTQPLYNFAGRIGRLLQHLVVHDGKISNKPTTQMFSPLAAWTSERDLRPLDPITFRDWWKKNRGSIK